MNGSNSSNQAQPRPPGRTTRVISRRARSLVRHVAKPEGDHRRIERVVGRRAAPSQSVALRHVRHGYLWRAAAPDLRKHRAVDRSPRPRPSCPRCVRSGWPDRTCPRQCRAPCRPERMPASLTQTCFHQRCSPRLRRSFMRSLAARHGVKYLADVLGLSSSGTWR